MDTFLDNVSVVELGDRLAVGLCGGLLQRLGADVVVVERGAPARESKWAHRPLLAAGKQILPLDFGDVRETARLANLLANADVVLISSDRDAPLPATCKYLLDAVPIVCDITAFGHSGPCSGESYTDTMMQAMAGLMDTTGSADGPPTATQVPITECGAAVFAAAGVLCGLHGKKTITVPQRVDVAMFDTAVSMLSTFLPGHFAGAAPQRMGNRHPSMSPWNAYPAQDGWVLLCSASNEMWKRVCGVIGRRDLVQDARFTTMPGRVKFADEVDATVLPWIRDHAVNECVEKFTAAGVPCGPVYKIEELLADANLQARGAFARLRDPASGEEIAIPGPLIRGSSACGQAPAHIPDAGVSKAGVKAKPPRNAPRATTPSHAMPGSGVLAGIRVLEMGSYTTAPLAARNLGALGAYVVKLEPPAGELSRASPPHVDGQSYFCTLSNSDKRCVAVDLQTAAGKALFTQLLAKADVFVENMKPGALERFGFGPTPIAAINPALVYCSVSGFGAGSPLAGRPAMDSTIQGMAGVMDLTRQDDTP
ncbi:MAG: CoA transferase [Betaproteobacteria bacterium]|nr:CoA transferase [Betaproteobacteria bacterium]